METYSTPAQIAEVVYEAATDGKDQLWYLAGADAKTTYAARLQLGDEAFRKAIRQQFFGWPANKPMPYGAIGLASMGLQLPRPG